MKAVGSLAMLMSLVAGCASTPKGAPPAFLSDERSCAVITIPEPAPQPADERNIEAMGEYFWTTTRNAISKDLYERIAVKHRIAALEVPYEAREQATDLVSVELAKHKCNRIIQLSVRLSDGDQGPVFDLILGVLRARPDSDPKSEDNAKTEQEYAHGYRFPRTSEMFEKFSISQFGERAYQDALAKGAFDGITR